MTHYILPNYYLITPDFDGNMDSYLNNLKMSLDNGVSLVQIRSKNLNTVDYIKLAEKVLKVIKSYQARCLLNGNASLLSSLDADGIHLPSKEYLNLTHRPVGENYLLSVACHNKEQIDKAVAIRADFAVLCPIFSTPSSPRGIPIGWENFVRLLNGVTLPIYALGGLGVDDLSVARTNGACGIAAKRGLWGLAHPLFYS